jgi:ABC-type tungstate transport system permease subunit
MATPASSEPQPTAIYKGSYGSDVVQLRIGNGGAGQSGLVRALADAFIDYMVSQKELPFAVGWYRGDTTETLNNIASGLIDIGITYNAAAEQQSMDGGHSVKPAVYGFRDHFLLVGPAQNPAGLDTNTDDTIWKMVSKIIATGNNPPQGATLTTVFLSRFDQSATNIKESELFVKLGHTPWAHPSSLWYHQYPRFPLEALSAASLLQEYTITDRGTLLSSPPAVQKGVVVYYAGGDEDPNDPLLNPAHVLLAARAPNPDIARAFMTWMASLNGGQAVVKDFMVDGQPLYSPAP